MFARRDLSVWRLHSNYAAAALSLAMERTMLKPENQKDKKRFEKLKDVEVEHGRGEEKATEVAAKQTKELRRREGRSKEDAP
jgi:hypothetical protein